LYLPISPLCIVCISRYLPCVSLVSPDILFRSRYILFRSRYILFRSRYISRYLQCISRVSPAILSARLLQDHQGSTGGQGRLVRPDRHVAQRGRKGYPKPQRDSDRLHRPTNCTLVKSGHRLHQTPSHTSMTRPPRCATLRKRVP